MISIIIVNYNTALFVNKAIESILLHTKDISSEIIIVDNNSSQDLQFHISVFKEKVSVIYLAENIGFGRANNEGLKIATGRYVFFLNPDTILLNNAVGAQANNRSLVHKVEHFMQIWRANKQQFVQARLVKQLSVFDYINYKIRYNRYIQNK
ncbi:MAG TPA: glycosyltransferase [Paludibacteraceae bacterium]|nr:glycosyltransferase [Paludibacteraceae bacterium]